MALLHTVNSCVGKNVCAFIYTKRNMITSIKSNFISPYRVTRWLFRHVKNTACIFSKTVNSRCPSGTKMHKNRSRISTGANCNISTSFLLVGNYKVNLQ
jgi:hypothetical protein